MCRAIGATPGLPRSGTGKTSVGLETSLIKSRLEGWSPIDSTKIFAPMFFKMFTAPVTFADAWA